MSATRDKNQKAMFVYTNLYQLYRKESRKEQVNSEEIESLPFVARPNRNILKAEELRAAAAAPAAAPQPRIEAYNPPAFIGKRVERPEYLAPQRNEAIESLKENLKTLNDLHSRLRFMLQELEELVK
ncbi:MAG: hypothetical protein NDJ90_04120 [Oligoflexia bacterium]|nr:hypothetical protein [Oligoflexia bacterium]